MGPGLYNHRTCFPHYLICLFFYTYWDGTVNMQENTLFSFPVKFLLNFNFYIYAAYSFFSSRLSSPNPRTYIGSGKVSEIKSAIRAFDVETVIFDDELSPGYSSANFCPLHEYYSL